MDQLLNEEQIRQVEAEALYQYVKGMGEAPKLYKPFGTLLKGEDADAEDGSGTFTFVANEESEDRMGDIIMVDGWRLKNFKDNNVIMWAHDYRTPNVGNAPRVWKTSGDASSKVPGNGTVKQLLNTVVFDMADPFAALIGGKVARKSLKAESVGFRPLEFEAKDPEHDSFFDPIRFLVQDLLEISIVPIPAHPRALAKAMSIASFSIPDTVKLWAPPVTVTTDHADTDTDDDPNDDPNGFGDEIDELTRRVEALEAKAIQSEPDPEPDLQAVDPPASDVNLDPVMQALRATREKMESVNA